MFQGLPGSAGRTVRTDGPKLNILNGHDPQNSNFPQILGAVATGITIRSGQVISMNDDGQWIRGYDPAFENSAGTLSIALQDSSEFDVIEGGKLTGIPFSTPNFVFQTAWFLNSGGPVYRQGTKLIPDGTTGKLKPITHVSLDDDVVVLGSATSGAAVVSSSDTTNVGVGDKVVGTSVPAGTIVLSVDSATQFTLSANVSANISAAPLTIQKKGFTFTKGSGAAVSTSTTLTTATNTGVKPGDLVSGTGIPSNTRVISVDSSTTLTMSAAATASNTGLTITFTRDGQALDVPVLGFVSQSSTAPKAQPENVAGPRGRPNVTSAAKDGNGEILVLTVRSGYIPGNLVTVTRT